MSSSKFPGADSPVRIYALGGLGEVGKNCYCVENDADLVILDSGVKFPDYTTPGVNYIIPDFTHLKEVSQKCAKQIRREAYVARRRIFRPRCLLEKEYRRNSCWQRVARSFR